MQHRYSLAHLTAMALPPVDLIEVAARTGYDYVGLRLSRVCGGLGLVGRQ